MSKGGETRRSEVLRGAAQTFHAGGDQSLKVRQQPTGDPKETKVGATMASSRKGKANRANAQRSTGPRSAMGKAQSRLNAFKHGLASSASARPELAPDITALAKKIAEELANDPIVLQAAMRVAEAAVDVNRVRWARRELLDRVLGDPE